MDLKEEDYDKNFTCVFWDESLDDGFGNWSSEGCRLTSDVIDKAECACDHLTSFALLMVCRDQVYFTNVNSPHTHTHTHTHFNSRRM